ncbi:7-cyano-7-deazaguanine synthase QueC [Thermosulfurimonas dismutans]|uniref:7-cyano-7-deazaguanine synthase n=1 Tax=Thermosulfurimonas dismutans TaxID=999894 RepID=A0A179D4V0_9BACT|nr:7-cyano-7-deazaguanine synthase QueC [Thermosulfurimonas dismutans]OAQ20749.1 Queuosine Biosynthesis QueC ATPase [Thermosulfurimonas dismutans]
MKRPLAVVLVSGGLDSCVTAAVAAQEHDVAFLHVKYGQRTESREEKAFFDLCEHFRPKFRLVTEVPALKAIGGSALTDTKLSVPEEEPDPERIPITYVPFRNAHFLCVAVSWAEVIGAEKIFIGANQVDFSGYPDCRRSFFDAFERTIEEGTRPETHIRIETPLINLTKPEIVRLGVQLGAPFHLTWSCYQNEKVACGRCESCRLRLKAFSEAGLEDPIPYEESL